MRQWATPVFTALLVLITQAGCTTVNETSRTKAKKYHHRLQLQQRQQQQQQRCCRCYVRPSSSCRVPTNSSITGAALGFVCWSPHRVRRRRGPPAAPPWGCSGAESCSFRTSPGYRDGTHTAAGDNQGIGRGRGSGRRGEMLRAGGASGDLGSDEDSKGGDEGGAGERPPGEIAAALERMYSMPATEKRRQISEGLGNAAPTPRQRVRLQRESLEMKWRMAGRGKNISVCCRDCAGEGKCQCRFCDGTGMFKIGKELVIDPLAGRPAECPVCGNTGEETCKRCKGAGRIASWLLRKPGA